MDTCEVIFWMKSNEDKLKIKLEHAKSALMKQRVFVYPPKVENWFYDVSKQRYSLWVIKKNCTVTEWQSADDRRQLWLHGIMHLKHQGFISHPNMCVQNIQKWYAAKCIRDNIWSVLQIIIKSLSICININFNKKEISHRYYSVAFNTHKSSICF